jgi:esterase/lipase superfamily enzyme
MDVPSSELLVAIFAGLALVLLVLGWLATRRLGSAPKIILRVLLVGLAVTPLLLPLLSLDRAASPPKSTAGAPDAAKAPREEAPGGPIIAQRPEPSGGSAPPPASTSPPPLPPQMSPPQPPRPEASAPLPPPSSTGAPSMPPAAEPPREGSRSAARKRSAPPSDAWQVVPVFYGTDRIRVPRPVIPTVARTAVEDGAERLDYGPGRAGRLELGQALVTVPKVHQVPAIERPWVYRIPLTDIVIYAEKEDPALHFTLQEVQALSREDFLMLVRQRLEQSAQYDGHALVFVHGYNTTFDYALYRTAQIAYDLGFDGAPFVYSWPSNGAILSYPYDRESAEQAQPHLREFLELVTRETGAKSVSIIAHSMGNQLLMPVLRELKRSAPPGIEISELILAAPDVGRDNFAFLAREIRGLAKGVTLYASSTDRALLASRQFWSTPRAGEVPTEGPFLLDGIDTIDVTALSTEVFGLNHSGFAERTPLIADIRQLIQKNMRPPETREPKLQKVPAGERQFWRYTP